MNSTKQSESDRSVTLDAIRTDPARLNALRETRLLDTEAEEVFDRLTRLAVTLLEVPAAFISFVDENRDFYKSACGLGEPLASDRQMHGPTFCHYTILSQTPLIIPDTAADPLYHDVPTVKTLGVAAYIGIPLMTSDGYALGSFSVIDTKPRQWTNVEIEVLTELAASANREIDLRNTLQIAHTFAAQLQEQASELEQQIEESHAISATLEETNEQLIETSATLENRTAEAEQAQAFAERAQADAERAQQAAEQAQFLAERAQADAERAKQIAEQAQAIAESAQAQAQNANTAKNIFLATMSHELRTPLNAIGGYVQLLDMGLQGEVNPRQRDYFRRIQNSNRILLSVINDILNFAKLEAGHIEFHLSECFLDKILPNIGQVLEPQFHTKEIDFTYIRCSSCVAFADPERIEQIVLNLLTNAAKFTASGGTVTLTAQVIEDTIHVLVADSGRGIPADKLNHIFDPFVQVDRQPGSTQQGVGLGLAISRELALGMGGDLRVESEVGIGSTFTLILPRATQEQRVRA